MKFGTICSYIPRENNLLAIIMVATGNCFIRVAMSIQYFIMNLINILAKVILLCLRYK